LPGPYRRAETSFNCRKRIPRVSNAKNFTSKHATRYNDICPQAISAASRSSIMIGNFRTRTPVA
jgi:hypothetical protein